MIAAGSSDSITAVELFNGIFNASLAVMLITLIASLGMTFSVRQILEPAKRIWLLIGTIVVNTLLAPLIAIGVCELLPLTAEAEIGVAIVTIAAAGPAGLKACQLAKGADLAMAVSFTIVLQLLNIIAAPLWAEVVVTGATVDPLSIVADMVVLVLAPLVVGLILRGRYPDHREGWKAGLEKISNIALFVVIAVGLGVNWESVVTSLGSWVIVASVIIIVAYMLLGFAVGFRDRKAGDHGHDGLGDEVHPHRPGRHLDGAGQPGCVPDPGTAVRVRRHDRAVCDRGGGRTRDQPTGCIQRQRHPSRHPPRWRTPCMTSSTRSS